MGRAHVYRGAGRRQREQQLVSWFFGDGSVSIWDAGRIYTHAWLFAVVLLLLFLVPKNRTTSALRCRRVVTDKFMLFFFSLSLSLFLLFFFLYFHYVSLHLVIFVCLGYMRGRVGADG